MEELFFLAQRTTRQAPNASFAAGAMIGLACGGLILISALIASIWAIVRWPDPGASRIGIMIPLLLLPFTGGIVFGFFRLIDEPAPDGAIFVVPVGWLVWLIVFVYARTQIREADKASEWVEAEARARQHRGPSMPPGMQGRGPVRRPGAAPMQGPAGQAQQTPQEAPAPPQPGAAAHKPQPKVSAETPVIARCTSCMGRWKTTAGEAKELDACPKCGASPPDLRLQRA